MAFPGRPVGAPGKPRGAPGTPAGVPRDPLNVNLEARGATNSCCESNLPRGSFRKRSRSDLLMIFE